MRFSSAGDRFPRCVHRDNCAPEILGPFAYARPSAKQKNSISLARRKIRQPRHQVNAGNPPASLQPSSPDAHTNGMPSGTTSELPAMMRCRCSVSQRVQPHIQIHRAHLVRAAGENQAFHGFHGFISRRTIQGQSHDCNGVLRIALHLKLPFPAHSALARKQCLHLPYLYRSCLANACLLSSCYLAARLRRPGSFSCQFDCARVVTASCHRSSRTDGLKVPVLLLRSQWRKGGAAKLKFFDFGAHDSGD